MKISVVIPVYNVEDYIQRCLDSVVNQTYKDLEIIIVDDGSTDNSGKICDIYAECDKRITVIHKENGGLVSARKIGVMLANGEYVSYVDSDDWIDLNMYELLVQNMSTFKPEVIAFGYLKEYEQITEYCGEYLQAGMYYKSQKSELIRDFLEKEHYFYTQLTNQPVWAKLLKKELIQKEQIEVDNNIRLGEDVVSYACVLNANSFMIQNIYPYHYRVRKNSICNNLVGEYERFQYWTKYLVFIMGKDKQLKPLMIQMIYYHLLQIDAEKLLKIKSNKITLFPKIKNNSNIILFGKGVVGHSIYKCLRNFCNIMDWIDSSDNEMQVLKNRDYDFILIAIAKGNIVKKIEQNLLDKGVPINKIMKIEMENLLIENLPEDIQNIVK